MIKIIPAVIIYLLIPINLYIFFPDKYEIQALENSSCSPRWTYTYADNVKEDAQFVVSNEFAIMSWEDALNDPDLFTLDLNSKNIIGYADLEPTHLGTMQYTSYSDINDILEFTILVDSEVTSYSRIFPILLHELGHAMGLEHNKSKDTIMYKDFLPVYYPTLEDIREANKLFQQCD